MSDPISTQNHLPSDLVKAILLLLPPKSLGRFKSVSKPWCSFISSHNFIRTHTLNYTETNPNPDPTHMILVPEDGEFLCSVGIKQLNTQTSPETLTAKRLNLNFQGQWAEIQGSCNGLVLANDIHDNLYLVNPTTRKSRKVPDSGVESSFGIYGFGYDSSKDDYRVISISYKPVSDSDSNLNCTSQVYSLRNNSWNKLPNFPHKLHDHLCPGVLLNNKLHWVVRNTLSTMTIASFCLADEEFHEIELPDSFKCIRAASTKLCAVGGKLVVVRCDQFHYELWVMKEYGVPNSWTELCVIYNFIDLDCELFAQVNNHDILLGNSSNGIVIHNMDEGRSTSVTVQGYPGEFMVAGTYVESLESLERFR
ncbi:F-box/kelch-repeat protein At3g06240-like [Rutidosis leptorrhynchoides]|uniref:F-box/kelch-repeat protein At3g06240-like n=1 Tax=Rutidosis leptorrhynchoides TaxID=125765 RepID=UPI003A992064